MESIRKGWISYTECEGMDYTKPRDLSLITQVFSQFWAHFPLKGMVRHYHTGLFSKVFGSIWRRFLNKEIRERFQTGLTSECRLDTLFLVPDAETARKRVIKSMHDVLKRRFENETNFSLSDVADLGPLEADTSEEMVPWEVQCNN